MIKVNFKSPEEFHTKLGMFFSLTIALPLLPFVWLYLEIKHNEFSGFLQGGLYSLLLGYVCPILAGLLVIRGFGIYKSGNEISKEASGLKEKLVSYYTSVSTFYVYVAVASILLASGLYLSAKGVLIVSYVILLFVMSFFRPTPKRYCKDLDLQEKEKDIILNQKEYKF
ncbi:MAG: hypothetical protein RLO81_19905 [Fulvivirga sp.]|uniref:hypothetical protein n=1 Tax=Fulvivirga sp. TaxID=1931237 RepID=UPI0032EAF925